MSLYTVEYLQNAWTNQYSVGAYPCSEVRSSFISGEDLEEGEGVMTSWLLFAENHFSFDQTANMTCEHLIDS